MTCLEVWHECSYVKQRGNSGESDNSLIEELWALLTYGLHLSVLNEI